MPYNPAAIDHVRLHLAYNLARGRLWVKPTRPPHQEELTTESLSAIERYLPKAPPRIPQELLERLPPADTYDTTEPTPTTGLPSRAGTLGQSGTTAAPGRAQRPVYLAAPIIQSRMIDNPPALDGNIPIARHTAWANLDEVQIYLTNDGTAPSTANISLWLVPAFVEEATAPDPTLTDGAINITPRYDSNNSAQIFALAFYPQAFQTTLTFDQPIPWIPYSLILKMDSMLNGNLIKGYAVTRFTPTLPADPRIRIPTSPVIINRTTITAQLPTPPPPPPPIVLSIPRPTTTIIQAPPPPPAPPAQPLPRAVKIKIWMDGQLLNQRTIAWASLAPELKREALNAMVTGQWPRTMEPIY